MAWDSSRTGDHRPRYDPDEFKLEYEVTPPPPERPTIEEFILSRLREAELEGLRFKEIFLCNTMIQLVNYGRTVIDWHKNWPTLVEGPIDISYSSENSVSETIAYAISQKVQWMTNEEFRKRFGSEPPTAPLLRSLANIWANHIDFNPEWRI